MESHRFGRRDGLQQPDETTGGSCAPGEATRSRKVTQQPFWQATLQAFGCPHFIPPCQCFSLHGIALPAIMPPHTATNPTTTLAPTSSNPRPICPSCMVRSVSYSKAENVV